ncbi:hypothetical protein M3J09_004112 [Ascochyta lentis]
MQTVRENGCAPWEAVQHLCCSLRLPLHLSPSQNPYYPDDHAGCPFATDPFVAMSSERAALVAVQVSQTEQTYRFHSIHLLLPHHLLVASYPHGLSSHHEAPSAHHHDQTHPSSLSSSSPKTHQPAPQQIPYHDVQPPAQLSHGDTQSSHALENPLPYP